MSEAARLYDPIGHSCALAGFLAGALIGVAVIAFASLITCAPLAGLLLGFLAAGIASEVLALGEDIGRAMRTTAGQIATGSPDVFINGRPAARAVLSSVACDRHSPVIRIAEGSASVTINGQPAARRSDRTECDAPIGSGSPNVTIGGGIRAALAVRPEIPQNYRTAASVAFIVAGLMGGVARAGAGIKCALGFIGGELLGMGAAQALSGLTGNPVDVTTGQKILLPERDFTLPGRLPVSGERFYASHLTGTGWLGRGWRHGWEISLRDDGDMLTLTGAQGRELSYPKAQLAPGHQVTDPGEQLTLSHLNDGRFVLHYPDRTCYVFGDFSRDGVAALVRMEAPYGQHISFGYEEGRLTQVTASSGHRLVPGYIMTPAGERLAQIALAEGGTPGVLVAYRYDEHGQLIAVENRAGVTVRRFGYDDGAMVEHRNATGFVCRYRWATQAGVARVAEHTTSDGEHYRFDYDIEQGHTTVTGRQGEVRHWWYDARTRVTGYRSPEGEHYRFDYNPDGFPVRVTLPGARTISLEYDGLNRVVSHTDPAGRVTRTAWNGRFDEITRRELDGGHVWTAEYDDEGGLLQETDPEGRVTRHTLDARGLPESRTDAQGGQARLTHDERGQLTAWTDCSGRTTRYAYDADGHLAAVTDAGGNTTRLFHNRQGLPERVAYPDGREQRYGWDAAGQLTRHSRAPGSEAHWSWTPRGRLAVHTDEEGRQTRRRYTPEGELAALVNGNGAQYRFLYDRQGRLTGEQWPDGLIHDYRYDAAGNLAIRETRGTGGGVRQVEYQYDAAGRPVAETDIHAVRTFRYNRLDQLTEVTLTPTETGTRDHQMQPDTVRFDYDRSGRLLAEHTVNGSLRYRRDALGNPTDVTLPDGQRLSHLYYGSGHLIQTVLDGLTLSEYGRDALHRQVMRTQGALVTRTGYDAGGRLSWQRSLRAEADNPEAGPAPQPACVTARDYRYRADGELTDVQDRLRDRVVWSYDRSGWLTGRDGAMCDHERFRYDRAGNLLAEEGQAAVMDNRLPGAAGEGYRYNEWGELTQRRGQRLRWNARGQLTQVTGGGSRTRYRYDALGRRLSRVTHGVNPGAGEYGRTGFVWEGYRLLQEVAGGVRRTWLYDPEQPYTPVACVTGKGDGRRVCYCHTDPTGTVQEVTDSGGNLLWAGSQRGWGGSRGDISASGAYYRQPLRLPGQYFDEESGLHYNLFRYYDPECGRFISPDPIGLAGGINLYSYAPNPLGWIDPLGLRSCFSSSTGQKRAEDIIKKHGGIQTVENRYQMPNRRAARQAASELAGNLGSERIITRKPDFRGGPYMWRDSQGRIGATNASGTAGWRDDMLGHPEFGAGSHVNAWNEAEGILSNLHLDY